jgi:hypothetical protein
MQTIDNLNQDPAVRLSNYMDSCTITEYQTISKILRDQLGWSRTVLSNKKSGKSPLTKAELIAIPLLINRSIF